MEDKPFSYLNEGFTLACVRKTQITSPKGDFFFLIFFFANPLRNNVLSILHNVLDNKGQHSCSNKKNCDLYVICFAH